MTTIRFAFRIACTTLVNPALRSAASTRNGGVAGADVSSSRGRNTVISSDGGGNEGMSDCGRGQGGDSDETHSKLSSKEHFQVRAVHATL
jgi:hypothetical protein